MTNYLLFVSLSVGTIIIIFAIIVIHHEMKCRKARRKIPELLTSVYIEGRNLRRELAKNGISLSYGSFNIIMKELEKQKLCHMKETLEIIEGEKCRVRWYCTPNSPFVSEEHAKAFSF
ncbi:MAG: hypothetical protein P4L61_03185 [Candidatus Pacebacteria bacterium]|nr:hypothetical protein [Candidatus Paceibacterota bacterium]